MKQTVYQHKVETLRKFANHEKTDHVPIINLAQTWGIGYGGGTLEECVHSHKREMEVYGKHLKDMYFDGVFSFGVNRPLSIYEPLGYAPYFASPDGVTLQTDQHASILETDEIDKFCEDPQQFLVTTAIGRRYPNLQKSFPEDVDALNEAVKKLMVFFTRVMLREVELRFKYQTPMFISNLKPLQPPIDLYLCFRGFKTGMSDMRRRPEQVKKACEAICEQYMPMKMPASGFPWVFGVMLFPDYISPKMYDELLWPTFKKNIDAYVANGDKIHIVWEGGWSENMLHFLEYPKGTFIISMQGREEDFKKAKEAIGDKVALCYPFPLELLKNGTPEEVKAHAKHIMDTYGMEGVGMCAERTLLSANDVNPENYKALTEFCLAYKG